MERDEPATFTALWRLLRPSPWLIAAAVVLGGLASLSEAVGITLFIPILNGLPHHGAADGLPHIVQRIFFSGRQLSLLRLILLMFVLVLVKNLLVCGNRALLSWVEGHAGNSLRCRIFDRLMTAGYGFWEKRDPGKILDTLANESWRATQALQLLTGSLLYSCTILVFTILLLAVSWRLTLLVATGLGVISCLVRLLSRPLRSVGDQAVKVNAELGARMWDGVAGIHTIQAFSLQPLKQQRFADSSERVRASFLRLDLLSGTMHPATEVLYVGLFLLVLAWQLPRTTSLPTTLVFMLLLFRLQPNLTQLHSCFASITGLSAAIRDVGALLNSSSGPSTSGPVVFERLREAIVLDRVTFRYEGEPRPALDNVSARIPALQLTAIVGASGAGKSTLAQLLCRFYDPSSGSIQVDKYRLPDLNLESWRKGVALASQETHLFSTTVKENIAMGRSGASDADVISAANMAMAHEFIEELPNGYDTAVGERGLRLSGGQRQRIALARALVRGADVLILDEATNALDIETEYAVMMMLRELSRRVTVIMIAHRLSAVSMADHVIVLENGRISEQGRPADLMRAGQSFAALYQSQRSLGDCQEAAI